jgi:DNA polymerase III delta prime subunit
MDPDTFILKYKPYFIRDFYLEPTHLTVLNALQELDDLNLLVVGNSCSGKTSLIYAIIREYYGMNESAVFPEHNIMFINNLKEQGIQFFRTEMKTFCQSKSNIPGKKKIIVVDDIDTINEQSQQVFRNYMDKYSKNIHFISVCTNIQKVNESLQSRLHILKINQVDRNNLETTMNKIVEKESLIMDADAKNFLLNISDNSIRVLINHLEKIYILGQPVNMELVHKLCSNISYVQFDNYIHKLKSGDLGGAIAILYEIYDHGYSVIDILDYFFTYIKMTKTLEEVEKYRALPFLCKYITIFHKVHEDVIELAFFTNSLMNEVLRSESAPNKIL